MSVVLNLNEINDAVNGIKKSVPTCIILNTIKGAGISFMENNPEWHSKCPSEEEYKKAKIELGYE